MANVYLSAASKGENALWRYLLCTPLALALGFAGVLGLAKTFALFNAVPKDLAAQMAHVTDPPVFFGFLAVVFALLLAGYLTAIPLTHRRSPFGALGAFRPDDLARGFLVWTLVLLLFTGLDLLIDRGGLRFSGGRGFLVLLLSAGPGLFIQTFAEEFVFRGYATQGFLVAFRNPVLAAVLSGAAFGALHIPNGLPQAANALAVGVALSLVAIRTGGLAFGFGLHFANNLFGAALVVSSDDVFRGSPALFQAGPAAHPWLDVALGAAALVLVAAFAAPARTRLRSLGGKPF